MLDLKALTQDPDKYRTCLKNRRSDPKMVDAILEANEERKKVIQKTEALKAQQNKVNQDIAQLKRNKQDATALLEQMKTLSGEVKTLEVEMNAANEKVNHLLMIVPNLYHESVPVGQSEADNVVVRTWGERPSFSFKPKEHWEIGEALGLLDFERAARVTGARFSFVRSQAARLERALMNFMLDMHTQQHGYEEVNPPFLVNRNAMTGTGNLPKFEEDLFRIEKFDFFLIPTAEVPVTNFFREEILEESVLPKGFTAYSPCFRAEAGSYGKDTKGIIRQHQFNKVEIVRFSKPEESYEQLELLTSHAEAILQKLGLHYRVSTLCSADITFGSAKTYDLEVWLPGQNVFREISSCSNFESFQARRANIRYRPKGGKVDFVHTLNGSGLAIGRTLVAILENYQQADGSVLIPEALQPYCGFSKISKS